MASRRKKLGGGAETAGRSGR